MREDPEQLPRPQTARRPAGAACAESWEMVASLTRCQRGCVGKLASMSSGRPPEGGLCLVAARSLL